MILDERTEFCDATSVVLTAGSAWQNVGDVIDLGTAARDVGNGEPLYLVIAVGNDGIDAAGAGTFNVRLVSDAIATPDVGTATVHVTGPQFVTSTTSGDAGGALAPGKKLLVVALPQEGQVYERYLGVQVHVVTQNTTAGNIDAFLTHSVANWKSYDAPFQL